MVTKQASTAARRRAREAKARRDAKRQAQEKKIAEANEDFYIALAAMDEAQAALDAATDERNAAVRALVALDQEDEAIAELTGLEVRDVAKIKKTPGRKSRSRDTTAGDESGQSASSAQPGAGDDSEAVPA